MLRIQVIYDAAREAAAEELCSRLERGAECNVRLQEAPPHGLIECWDEGLDSQAIIVLLSSGLVPPQATREAWEPVLEHVEKRQQPEVAFVELEACAYPKLLERQRLLRWDGESVETPRALIRWVVGLREGESHGFEIAKQPYFTGRQTELGQMMQMLVDGSGALALHGPNGIGKTALAQEFARLAAPSFRDVIWLECGQRPARALAGELGHLLKLRLEGDMDSVWRHLGSCLEEWRLLLVMDGWRGEMPFTVSRHGRGSLLITSCDDIPGIRQLSLSGDPYPFEAPSDPLTRIAATCAREGFPLELAARVAGLPEPAARARFEEMAKSGLLTALDAARSRYRLGRLATPADPEWRLVAGTLDAVLLDWRGEECAAFVSQLERVITPAFEARYELARSVTRRACLYFKEHNRRLEAAEYYSRLRDEAIRHGDDDQRVECDHELSWLLGSGGTVRQPFEATDQMSLF